MAETLHADHLTQGVLSTTDRRLSWSGIIAGVFVAIAVQLLLNLLGIGVGASSINPSGADGGGQPGQGMAIGALLWFVLSWVLSLALGAWTASQFSAVADRWTGVLQGLLVWSVSSLVIVYLLTTAVGSLIGGTASVVGRTASLVGNGAKLSAPGVGSLVSRATGITPQDISNEAGIIASDPNFQRILTDAFQHGSFSQTDRDSLISLLEAQRQMSASEANATLDKWQGELTNAVSNAKSTAIKVEEHAASGVSATGFVSFLSLLLGLAAAIAGGVFGIRQRFGHVFGRARA